MATDYLSTEAGDRLLTESGDNIILDFTVPLVVVKTNIGSAYAFPVGWTGGVRRIRTNANG